jgi:hypothetical protein
MCEGDWAVKNSEENGPEFLTETRGSFPGAEHSWCRQALVRRHQSLEDTCLMNIK